MKAQEKIQPGSNVNVTQDSLLYWLMQTATKADVGELRGEMRSDFSALRNEVKDDISELRGEIKSDINRLDARIDRLDTKVESVRTELKGDIASLRKSNHAFFFWVIGLMFGGFGTLVGFMLKLLYK